MRLIDQYPELLEKATKDSPEEVCELGRSLLRQFQSQPTTAAEFCPKIRKEINDLTDAKLRKEARKAKARFQDLMNERAHDQDINTMRRRQSAMRMGEEIWKGLELVEKQGKGVLFLGTARSKPGEVEYERSRELARETYSLLGGTTTTGAGPGNMESTVRGAKEIGGPICGVKITLDADEFAFEQNISDAFDADEVIECKYFAPRKVALVDSTMRDEQSDKTAVICLPGGFGTMDELFEVCTLSALRRSDTKYKVPILLMNYGGEYDGIIAFLDRAIEDERLTEKEKELITICTSNREALDGLADFYDIPEDQRGYNEKERLRDWNKWEVPTSTASP